MNPTGAGGPGNLAGGSGAAGSNVGGSGGRRADGGHGTTYLFQNFSGPGTTAKNDDGTPMQNWWVYLFY